MIMDLHTHTHHSPDAEAQTVEERAIAAEAMGLQYMAITDHVEINRFYPAAYYHAVESEMFSYNGCGVFEGSVSETVLAQQAHPSLRILCGAEIGQIPQDIEKSRMLYRDERVDLIIGSVHELPQREDFFFLDYSKENIPKLVDAYFAEVLRTAETDCYDILAHLTYGLRYLPNRAAYDLTPHLELIDEIFQTLIKKEKALELNGSGLKYAEPFTDPGYEMLCRYRKMGGRMLTISTDAHDTKYLGSGVAKLEEMAKSAGFTELVWFEKHIPHGVKL
ncbi:MAG: histidinol-phosphatase HisJ family protein [Oscillospiraceae bacterium]|nr:histidinol-phosphatase HisJ family protein [Oscillospiraceae bacterium]